MLKGNLVVGKTQSVVVRGNSLSDLIKLAEEKGCDSLRVSMPQGGTWFENVSASTETTITVKLGSHRDRTS